MALINRRTEGEGLGTGLNIATMADGGKAIALVVGRFCTYVRRTGASGISHGYTFSIVWRGRNEARPL